MFDWALKVATDKNHRLELALRLDDKELAMELALQIDSKAKWISCVDYALQNFDV